MDFESLNLSPVIYQAIKKLSFTRPTEIQVRAIPPAIAGQHIIGIAQTGTGKTAAYLIPLIMKLVKQTANSPVALILVPTKELVVQVKEHFEQWAAFTPLKSAALFGGVGKKKQLEELNSGAQVLIATPGRFLDLYHSAAFKANVLKFIVIDESDRMMDMGFLPQLRLILDVLPMKKQVLLFSATFPQKVEKLCTEFMDFPVRIEVTPQATTVDTIEQFFYRVPNQQTKLKMLKHIIDRLESDERVIIFSRSRKSVGLIHRYLEQQTTFSSGVIHANKEQNTRLNTLQHFRDGELRLLVATDIAARGLDVAEVDYVINFDVPHDHAEYVHRVGRTGRAQRRGKAFTLVNEAELYHLRQIEKLTGTPIRELTLPPDIVIVPTPFKEQQSILREIDFRKQKTDPTYQGAFHRRKPKTPIKKKSVGRRKR